MNLRPMARAMLLPRLVLPTPGGPTNSRIGLRIVSAEAAHREVLEDALLDLLEAVVVLVQDLRRLLDVESVVGGRGPRQRDEPVHVGADHADLGRGGRDPAHPVDLLDRPGAHLLRHAGGLDLVAELVDLGLLGIVVAQLPLDGLELLAEDVLPLGLVHLGLDLALDLPLELQDLDLAGKEARDELEPLLDIDGLEELLALLGGHVGAVGHHVGEEAGLGDVAGGDGGLRGYRCTAGDVLLDLGLDAPDERLDLDALGLRVVQLLHRGRQVRRGVDKAVDPDPALALDDRADRAVLQLDDLGDLGDRPDLVELGRIADLLLLGMTLGHQRNRPTALGGGVERGDALLAADLERDDHLREDDRLPERDERQVAQLGGSRLDLLHVLRLRRSLRHQVLLGLPAVWPAGRVDGWWVSLGGAAAVSEPSSGVGAAAEGRPTWPRPPGGAAP